VRLTTSSWVGTKYLVVLCAGFALLLVQSYAMDEVPYINCPELSRKLASINLRKFGSFSYWFNKPWFHNWGKTCCCAHHNLLLGFPTRRHIYIYGDYSVIDDRIILYTCSVLLSIHVCIALYDSSVLLSCNFWTVCLYLHSYLFELVNCFLKLCK
jgi:hypothetical protein